MIDITEKGAALCAAAEGRFDELPIHNPDVECCSRERIRGQSANTAFDLLRRELQK